MLRFCQIFIFTQRFDVKNLSLKKMDMKLVKRVFSIQVEDDFG